MQKEIQIIALAMLLTRINNLLYLPKVETPVKPEEKFNLRLKLL